MPKLFLIVSVLAVAATACASQEPGVAIPSDVTSTTKTTARPTTTTSKSAVGAGGPAAELATLDPCELLSETERGELGLAPGEPATRGTTKSCDWTKSGDWGVAVSLSTRTGLKDGNYHGGTPTPVEVGRHEATKLENMGGGNGACDVFIAITETSSAHITANSSGRGDTAKACANATLIGRIIDPKLP
ncbi:DUF3558 family protein [Actinokineospora iranica]|nr:DUF3558 family protein [Actinokineospora iranica]